MSTLKRSCKKNRNYISEEALIFPYNSSVKTNLFQQIWAMADDGTIGQIVHTLKGHEDSVRTCRFSPDSKYLATGDDQGFIKVSVTERYCNG